MLLAHASPRLLRGGCPSVRLFHQFRWALGLVHTRRTRAGSLLGMDATGAVRVAILPVAASIDSPERGTPCVEVAVAMASLRGAARMWAT